MRAMKFDVPCVRKCLEENGVVYTVRAWPSRDGLVLVDGAGVCRRRKVGEIERKEGLADYLSLSGFESVEGWWKKIERFVWRGDKRKWLFEVTFLEEETGMFFGGER